MADTDVTLFYNKHRLSALERILTESGSSVENALRYQLDSLYKDFVPEDEQAAIEALIAKEQAEEKTERESKWRFSVIHFHEGSDDFHFITELRYDFYSAAHLYRNYMKDKVGKYTLDSLASMFGDYQVIDKPTYDILCDTMPNDRRITALMDFDFDNGTVSVCESSDNAWWTYCLKDVSAAMYRAERKSGLKLETRREIFMEALAGKEIDMDGADPSIEESDSPNMQM